MSIVLIGRVVARRVHRGLEVLLEDGARGHGDLRGLEIRLRPYPGAPYRTGSTSTLGMYGSSGHVELELFEDIGDAVPAWAADDLVYAKTSTYETWDHRAAPNPQPLQPPPATRIDFANLKKCPSSGWTNCYKVSPVETDLVQSARTFADMVAKEADTAIVGIQADLAAAGLPPPDRVWTFQATMSDPLDVKYDGWTLRQLLEHNDKKRREEWHLDHSYTPAQRAAISAHWSAELRAEVAASKEADGTRERNRVTYCEED